MTELTFNGVTTTTEPHTERYETFKNHGKKYVQYDYRAADGELFSCVGKTLNECRTKCNEWKRINNKK